VKAVSKYQDAAFEKQGCAIEMLMLRRRYDESDVDSYLRNGLLPQLIKDSYQNYFGLLGSIRQLTFDHEIWEGGPAKAMLEYHSAKLLQIHGHTLSQKMLVLKTYIYLQDAAAKSYYNKKAMTKTLWEHLSQLFTQQPRDYDSAGGGDATRIGAKSKLRCAHCRSVTIHKALGLDPYKKHCFFKDLTQPLAQKAASKAIARHKATPTEPLREKCFVTLSAYKQV
jgi:hypothetical protein